MEPPPSGTSNPERASAIALLGPIARTRMVGRAREWSLTQTLWQQALAADAQTLLVGGEPGIGKTRLVRELVAAVRDSGGLALLGECYEEGGAPYAPLARLIADALDTPALAGLHLPESILADLLLLAPPLRPRFAAVPANPALDPQSERQRIFESVVQWCALVAARAPLAFVVEDVHWADSGTLLLLRHLVRRARRLPLLIVLTYREAELAGTALLNDVLIDFNRERLATSLRLSRLDRAETGELLATLCGGEVGGDWLDSIYGQTEGNPFFVEELCKALIEEGTFAYADGRWRRASLAPIKVPQTVRATIQARVTKLPRPAQETLYLASIIGREFSFEVLRRASDLDEDTLVLALEQATRAQLLVEDPQTGPARFAFVHTLIPTTLRESIIHLRRQRLHRRVALALEALRPDDFEALAYHYREASDAERASGYYLKAGDQARRAVAPAEAAADYRAALERWPEADRLGRAQVLHKLGECLWVTSDVPGALAVLAEAYALFEAAGERVQGGKVQRMIGRLYWEEGDGQAAMSHYQRALAILEQTDESVELAHVISSISQMYMLASDYEPAIEWGERALALAERLGAEDVAVHALNNLGASYDGKGQPEYGWSLLRDSLRRALALGLSYDACRALYNLGESLQLHGRYAEARSTLEELETYRTQVHARRWANLAQLRLADLDWLTGRWASALERRPQVLESAEGVYLIWARQLFALMDNDLGCSDAARLELEASLPGALRSNELQTTLPHLGELARAQALLGAEAAALEAVQQMAQLIDANPHVACNAARAMQAACLWSLDPTSPLALERLLVCLPRLARVDQDYPTAESRAALAEAKGMLELGGGRAPEAIPLLRQALAEWESIERVVEVARTWGALARAHAQAADLPAAQDASQHALAAADDLAAQLDPERKATFLASRLVQEIRAGAQTRAIRARPGRAMPAYPAGLTAREVEVLRLVAEGLSNAEIAGRLTLSRLTVNAHLRSIYNKLGTSSRASAARFAAQHGLD